MNHTLASTIRHRLRAAGVHLIISALLGGIVGIVVLGLWFPYPYREVSGGRELLTLLVSVDVVLGPLITMLVFDRRKPRRSLFRDLTFVAVVQLAALAYGVWSAYQARPVHLVFDGDRFVVVHAAEVATDRLMSAPTTLKELPLSGPTPVALRPFASPAERSEALLLEVQGLPLVARPEFWSEYPPAKQQVLDAAGKVAALRSRFPSQVSEIDRILSERNLEPNTALYLPMVARRSFLTVILDPRNADPVGFLLLDSF